MSEPLTLKITQHALNIDNYGAFKFDLPVQKLLEAGFSLLDIVEVSFFNQKIVCPIVPDYNYIDNGRTALTFVDGDKGLVVFLTIGGQCALMYGLATYDNGNWILNEGISVPFDITIKMVIPQGYRADYEVYAYLFSRRSMNRFDYADKSDEVFANYRVVSAGNIKPGILYRASSPINKKFNRNEYVDKLSERDGIKTFINMSDSYQQMEQYMTDPTTRNAYYLKQDVLLLNLPADYACDRFKNGLLKSLRTMLKNRNKTLIHCLEGKDRTGYFVALLEAFMGASKKEIMEDYVESHINFFKIDRNDYTVGIIQAKIIDILNDTWGVVLKDENLQSEAEKYLGVIGLSNEEIEDLRGFLSGN